MGEIFIIIQGASAIALFKIAIDLGRVLQKIEHHEKRLDVIEERINQ